MDTKLAAGIERIELESCLMANIRARENDSLFWSHGKKICLTESVSVMIKYVSLFLDKGKGITCYRIL